MQNAEYEIQHFGFSVEQMKLERRHVIKQHLSSLMNHLVNSLAKKSNVSQQVASKLIDIQKDVAKNMFSAFEPTLADIEKMDEKYFSIPDNVLLHQDFGHLKEYTNADEEKLKKEVEELKKQFLENSVMNSAIEAENAKYMEMQDVVQEELKVIATVQETFNAINIQKTRQMVNNVLSTIDK